MMRWFVSWMRVVLPDTWIVSFCVAAEMLIETVYLFCLWWGGQVDEMFFRNVRLVWLGGAALSYGMYRATAFHPALNEEYREWLKLTPWTADKPLPGGPIRQMPQDLVVLGGLMLLARDSSLLVLYLPAVYLFGYLMSLAVATRAAGDWLFAYLIGFGLGGIVLAGQSPDICVTVAMACYPIAFLAIRRSLVRFPWDIDWSALKSQFQTNPEEKHQDRHGWPFDFLSPKPPKRLLPYSDGICLSLLAGWYMFVAHHHAVTEARFVLPCFATQFITIGAIARLWDYMRAHRPPISLGGRICSGRWIIPGYDVIFVAPLLGEAILLATQVGAIALFLSNKPRLINVVNPQVEALAIGLSSAGVSLTLLVLCVFGPELERWRLTGPHRIVFDQSSVGGKSKQSPFLEL